MSLLHRIRAFVVRRYVQKHGIDLSRIEAIPEATRFPLQRDGFDPVVEVAQARSAGPLRRLDLPFNFSTYLVTGHAEAKEVLTGTDYSSDIRHLLHGDGPATAKDVGGLGFIDPPDHTRQRRLVTPTFGQRGLKRLEPIIEQIVEDALDALEAAGPRADFAELVAFPIPFNTICAVLGLDYEDTVAFSKLGRGRFDATNGAAAAFGAVSDQRKFLFEAVAKQRQDPGPGLIGDIIRSGEEISDFDLAGLADGVFTGGYETTANMLSLTTILLQHDPQTRDLLRTGDQATVIAVIEELLRYFSVVQVALPRFVTEDKQLFGQQVKKGDALLVSLVGADRDPAMFGDDAESFNPHRGTGRDHLAFGHGIHRCVGAELARLELRIALPRILTRFPDLRLAVAENELDLRQLSFVFGIDELPVLTGV